MNKRKIVLDTETTGLETSDGHRIIEIGGVEIINRRLTGNTFHQYINPEREIDAEASRVHGITQADLEDKPRFAEIADAFIDFIKDSELVIHNAPFDVGFLDSELTLANHSAGSTGNVCTILDTLILARKRHPGQRNSLDALCKRYDIHNTRRDYHGALLDAELLADVYLAMTGGQTSLSLQTAAPSPANTADHAVASHIAPLRVIQADPAEQAAHQARLEQIDHASDGHCQWLASGTTTPPEPDTNA